jgi:hypothetical protein
MKRRAAQWFRSGILIAGAMALAGSLPAQDAPAATPPAPNLTSQELENLVAPIALYPDPLLGQVLAAATYPVELVEAQQWLETVGDLSGQALMDAARQQDWDPSVQALVAMPDVMNLLTQDIRWTTDLGNAFLAQEGDVMSAVQRMRQRAQDNGKLQSNEQETVTTNYDNGQTVIEILPANPQVIYVPAYDPYYVYGYGAWPSLYYPDGYWFGPGINIGFYFGGWSGWTYGGWGWGWRPNWFAHNIYVNHHFFNRYGYHYRDFGGRHNVWAHNPSHRMGAGYPRNVAGRYASRSHAARIHAGRSGNWHTFRGGSDGHRGSANHFNGSRFDRSRVNGSNSFRGSGNGVRGAGSARAPQQHLSGNQSSRAGRSSVRSQAPRRNFQSTPQRNFQSAPQRNFQSAPRGNVRRAPQRSFQSTPQRSFQAPQRRAVPQRSVQPRQRVQAPHFRSAPHVSAQRSAPRVSAPRAVPHVSAPRSAPRNIGGGGGARSFGGGGGARRNAGGGFHGGGARGGHGHR